MVKKERVYTGRLTEVQKDMVHYAIINHGLTWKEAAKEIGKAKKSVMDDVKAKYPALTAKAMRIIHKRVPAIKNRAALANKDVRITYSDDEGLEVVS